MSKILKITLISLGLILVLLLALWAIMQTAAFQRFLGQKITSYLSDELGTEISISGLEVSYFDHLKLNDFLVKDQSGDTMIYVGVLDANYNYWAWTTGEIKFDKVLVERADVRLGIAKGEESMNLQFVIDYFTPDSPSGQSKTLKFGNIVLDNCRFNYFNYNYLPPQSRSFNENDILFETINADIQDFIIINDSISFLSKSLSSREQSGINIKDFRSACIISSTTMEFTDLDLTTDHSHLKDYLRFSYNSYRDFSDFIKVVEIVGELNNCSIHPKDLSFFSEELRPYSDLMNVSGHISGTIDNMTGEKLTLTVGPATTFAGDIKIKGIPDMADSYWDIDATLLQSNSYELGKYLLINNIPEEMAALGQIGFSGKFTGFLNEFVCYGNLNTEIGNAVTDIKFSVDPDGIEQYSGSLKTDRADLSKILDIPLIGNTAFNLNIVGKGLAIDKLNADIEGVVSYIEYNNYPYKNIELDGNIKEKVYTGYAKINDPNFDLEFNGEINAVGATPTINVTAQARAINLKTLGLDTAESIISFDGTIMLESINDDIYGYVKLDSFILIRSGHIYPVKELQIVATQGEDGTSKQVVLSSDILNLQLTGSYRTVDLPGIGEHMAWLILPHKDQNKVGEFPLGDIELNAYIPDYHPVLEEYFPEYYFREAEVQIDFSSSGNVLHSSGSVKDPSYQNYSAKFLNFTFDRNNRTEPLVSKIELDTVVMDDTLLFRSLVLDASAMGTKTDLLIKADHDSSLNATLDAYLISENDSFMVYINSLDALINDKNWHMNKTSFANIVYHDDELEIFYIDLRNEEEILFFDGAFGTGFQKFNIVMDNFLLENLNPFIPSSDMKLGGLANGYVDLRYYKEFPIFESDIHFDQFSIDGDTIGDFYLQSITGDNPLLIKVQGKMESGLVDKMDIEGFVDFNNPENALNINLKTNKSSIKPFSRYLEGLASDITGLLTTDIELRGPIDRPRLSGKALLTDASFKVDYLQTNYTATAQVEIGNDHFQIITAQIKDRYGNTGVVTGGLTHDNYRDFIFDINIDELKGFECMNTSRNDNQLFYGTAYADGEMEIKGPLDDILLVIRAKSKKGTKIYIPLDNVATDGQLSYVQFVDFSADNNQIKDPVRTTEGVRMDFTFDITNDAEVELIFDELLGDKINGTGHGNLRMEINTYGEFNMYGTITIDKGDYLFTAFNFINKYFTVTPGGTISWYGNPYNATIDLVATKREYPQPSTLLAGLVSDDELENYYSDPIPVDCKVKLTGLLFNPTISFDLAFPSTSSFATSQTSTFNTVIERIRQDQEELDRQVFALIALGTFIPPSFASNQSGVYSAGFQNSVNNSISDFVSSQLSNWLSQIDPKWQVGVDYQGATSSAKAELVLSLKRKFLNDRLELQGSYDASTTTGARPYDINVQYNLSKDGSFKIRGFQKNANDPTLGNLSNVTTSGVGFFYRHQFDYFWFNKPKDQDTATSN